VSLKQTGLYAVQETVCHAEDAPAAVWLADEAQMIERQRRVEGVMVVEWQA